MSTSFFLLFLFLNGHLVSKIGECYLITYMEMWIVSLTKLCPGTPCHLNSQISSLNNKPVAQQLIKGQTCWLQVHLSADRGESSTEFSSYSTYR